MELLSNEVTPHPDYLEEGPLSPMSAYYRESDEGPFAGLFEAIKQLFTGKVQSSEASA